MPREPMLVLTELFLPTKGGTAVWFDEVYRRLGGKEIHVVTAAVPGDAEHDRDHPNTIHRLPLRRSRWLRPESLGIYVRLFHRASSLAAAHGPRSVHAGRVLPEGLVGWLVARSFGRPLLLYAHGEEITTWRSPAKRRAMRFAFRHADRIVANSEFTRAALLDLGVAAHRIVKLHPGVDLRRFRPGRADELRRRHGIDPADALVLSVGRLSRRKGFDQVIRALAALRANGLAAHHVVIGIGEDARHLDAVARECGMEDRVHRLGHRSMTELAAWYRAADVFAMPNRDLDGDNEGFGLVFLEAAASGVPSLAGRAGGTGDAVLDGVTGVRVDGESVAAIADALRRLLTDAPWRARLGANALERARRAFSWEAVAARTREIVAGIE